MLKRPLFRIVAAIILFLGLASSGGAQQQEPYPNTPADLKRLVDGAVEGVFVRVRRGERPQLALEDLTTRWHEMVVLTVADATVKQKLADRSLYAYRNLGETARTDKQVGASSSGAGSTSLVQKGGIPLLLSYAIEHGAIQQEVNGTGITLSTSPYGLIAMATGGDTADNYKKYNIWTRFGFSATFNVNEGTPSVSSISGKQLTEYSARVRLLGDKSSRSAGFKKLWEEKVGPLIQKQTNLVSDAVQSLYEQESRATPLRVRADHAKSAVIVEVQNKFGALATLAEAARGDLADRVLQALYENIYQPVRKAEIAIPEKVQAEINNRILPQLGSTEAELIDARENLDSRLGKFYQSAALTFTFTGHRTEAGSDYSEFKLLFERHVAPIDVTANAGISIFHHPDVTMGQQTVRDFHASLQLEAHSRSLFKFSDNDKSKTIYALSGRYERMKETKADIGIVQAKIEIPLGAGLSLPFSFTYATRTELIDEKEVRGNFGLSFDLDKLYGLFFRLTEKGTRPSP
jgi:hypothetical protein